MPDGEAFSPAPAVSSPRDVNGELLTLFIEIRPVLLKWVVRKLGDYDAAHDVVQNAFIRVWTYADDHEIESPKSLLYKTAGRLALNEIRRRKRYNRRFAPPIDSEAHGEDSAPQVSAPRVFEATRNFEDAVFARIAVEGMNDRARSAFYLHRFEGLNYREIAERMNVSRSSVEKYMIRALADLRRATGSPAR